LMSRSHACGSKLGIDQLRPAELAMGL